MHYEQQSLFELFHISFTKSSQSRDKHCYYCHMSTSSLILCYGCCYLRVFIIFCLSWLLKSKEEFDCLFMLNLFTTVLLHSLKFSINKSTMRTRRQRYTWSSVGHTPSLSHAMEIKMKMIYCAKCGNEGYPLCIFII